MDHLEGNSQKKESKMESTSTRWKGKGFMNIAHANPMSSIIAQLRSSLIHSQARAILSGSEILLGCDAINADLCERACFGRQISNADKDGQWYQLGAEEAFYLHHTLNCIAILNVSNDDKINLPMNTNELWVYFKSKKNNFPSTYKAYSHLRAKNWVVRPGSQYGVDFVAYRHHPALVHSEFAVIVHANSDGDKRLRVWSDIQCSLRVSTSVAKTLLVLYVLGIDYDASTPTCLNKFTVEERTFRRWLPEQSREIHNEDQGTTKHLEQV